MSSPVNKPIVLIILDGWGYSPRAEGNAIALAHTPNYDAICREFPSTTLVAAGMRVGQSSDANGNAEVGHLNIGAGRAAQSEVFRIESAIRSGEFANNEMLISAFAKARENNKPIHLIGLLSDGGVHSSSDSLFALVRMARKEGLKDVFIHAILDGVDVPTRTADIYVEALEIKLADIGIGQIATMCGRYFAMDGLGNWERTARAYTMLVHAEGERTTDAMNAIRNSFLRGIADEFIAPVIVERAPGVPVATIKSGDTVIFFNHRPEAIRQLVRSISVPDAAGIAKPVVDTICLTEYDRTFNLPVVFRADTNENVLSEVLADNGIANLKITQSERFPHLTYYFNGGDDVQQPNEQQILLPTPRNETAENQPESQSFKITDKVLRCIEANSGGVFVVNLPAADLVAETGMLERTVEAVQFVDTCLGGIVDKVREAGGIALVTSTHGNCEEMLDLVTGEPQYLTTPNPVPFHFVSDWANGLKLRDGGVLADIAPTILGILNIEKPVEMTGRDLRHS